MPIVKISGMRCGHCVSAVTKALSALAGVSEVRVDLASQEASYQETAPVAASVVAEAIRKIGFEVVEN